MLRQQLDQASRLCAFCAGVSQRDRLLRIELSERKPYERFVNPMSASEESDPQIVVMQTRLVQFEIVCGQLVEMRRQIPLRLPLSDLGGKQITGEQQQREFGLLSNDGDFLRKGLR